MTSETAGWESAVREQVRLVAGDWAEEVAAAWTDFAAEPLVQVTLHGGYDTGKTSLLKRFLVEDGTPVPADLAVGALPTSYRMQRIESGGLAWVDTPGTDSGNDEHDALAAQALTLTDAVLVVLSPQLLSGGQGVVHGLLDGTFHNPVATMPLFAPGALVVAVSQMDTAGVSPRDDVPGYRRLVARKRDELTAALGAGAAVVGEHLHFIAADPDEAGQSETPDAEDYTGYEEWDGVADLRRDLRSLAARGLQLRADAGVRYWCRIGDSARRRAAEELAVLVDVTDESRRGDEVIGLLLEELDGIDRRARARLHETIYDQLVSGVLIGDADRADVEHRLNGIIGTWLAEWGGELDSLTRRAATELRVRAERPGAGVVQGYLDSLFADDLPSPTVHLPPIDQLFQRLDGHAKTVARAGYKMFHGMSVEDAKAELNQLRYLSADQLEKHFTSSQGMLTSADHAQRVRMSLHRMDAIEAVLPLALGLAEYLAADMLDRRAQRREAEMRAQLRIRADEIATEIIGGSGTGTWSDAVSSLRTELFDANLSRDVLSRSAERQAALTDAVDRLEELLSQVPGSGEAPAPGRPAYTV